MAVSHSATKKSGIKRKYVEPDKKIITKAANKPKKFYQDNGLVEDPNKVIGKKNKNKTKEAKTSELARRLEQKANKPQKKKFKFSKVMCEELEYYLTKYGEDYQAMARDAKNIYQDSPGQLRYKIIKYIKLHKRPDQDA